MRDSHRLWVETVDFPFSATRVLRFRAGKMDRKLLCVATVVPTDEAPHPSIYYDREYPEDFREVVEDGFVERRTTAKSVAECMESALTKLPGVMHRARQHYRMT